MKYELRIDSKTVQDYDGNSPSPLDNTETRAIHVHLSRQFTADNLTAQVIADHLANMLLSDRIEPEELFAGNETFLVYSRVENAYSDELPFDTKEKAYYATYDVEVYPVVEPLNLSEIDGFLM